MAWIDYKKAYNMVPHSWILESVTLVEIHVKTVVYHLVNGSTVLLRIENSKNDRLKVILLVAV